MAGFSAIPATKGQMGSWTYYVTTMSLAKVESTFKFASEMAQLKTLPKQQRLQRELVEKRIQKERIDEYLIKHEDRFFPALLVAIYGSDISFEPILDRLQPKNPAQDKWLIKAIGGAEFGLVLLDGNEQFFVLDGQHRLAAIRAALKKKNELGRETISVIFVKHDPKRADRSRRLFTTVNRYAKPPTQGEIYMMDEDDAVAIVARAVAFGHPLFQSESDGEVEEGGRVNTMSSSLPERSRWLTTLKAMYDMCGRFLALDMAKDGIHPQFRPGVDVIDRYKAKAWKIFDGLSNIDAWRAVAAGTSSPDDFREKQHLLFKPVGQVALAIGVERALADGVNLKTIIGRLNKIDWAMHKQPWVKVVFDPGTGRVLTGKGPRDLAGRILAHMLGVKLDADALRVEYARLQVDVPVEPSEATFGGSNGAYAAALKAYGETKKQYPKKLAAVKLPVAVT